jgi:hypothetical protein
MSEKKTSRTCCGNIKRPRHEISRSGYFVKTTTHSGMWRYAMMRNSCRGCFDVATTRSGFCWKKVSVNEEFTSSVMY